MSQKDASQKEREVWAACDSLFKEGKKPLEITIDALGSRLRELNYLRGKNEAISKYRKTWLDRLGMKDDSKKYDSPELIKSAVAERFQHIVEEELRKEYEERIQSLIDEKMALEKNKLALESSLAEFTENNVLLAEKNIVLENRTNEAEKSLQERENVLSEVKGRLALQTEFLEKREAQWQFERTQEQRSHQSQLDTLSSALVEQQEKHHQSLQMLRDNYESQRHLWIAEKDAFKTDIQKIQKALKASKEQETVLKIELQRKADECIKLEDLYKNEQVKCQEKTERITVLSAENEKICQYQMTVEKSYQKTVVELNKTLITLQDNVIQLLERVKNLSDKHEKE